MKANTHLKYKHTMLDERIVKQINKADGADLINKKYKQEKNSATLV